MAIQLEIVTPTGALFSGEVSSVTAPGAGGEFQMLPGHLPALIQLSGGVLRYQGEQSGHLYVRGGVAELSAGKALVLTEEAQRPEDSDPKRATALREEAQQRLESSSFLEDDELAQTTRDLRFADAVLNSAH